MHTEALLAHAYVHCVWLSMVTVVMVSVVGLITVMLIGWTCDGAHARTEGLCVESAPSIQPSTKRSTEGLYVESAPSIQPSTKRSP